MEQSGGPSEEMTGFSINELEYMGLEGWRGRIHPDDIERVITRLILLSGKKLFFLWNTVLWNPMVHTCILRRAAGAL